MPRTKSIPKFVRDLKPAEPNKRRNVPVPGMPGVYVRVTDKGTKTFTINPRPKGSTKQKWRSLPLALDMDRLTAEDEDAARTLAREGIARGRRGDEPFPPPPTEPDSLRTIADEWMKRHVRKNRLLTGDKIERTLERLVFPSAIANQPIDEIRRRDITELLNTIEDKNGSVQADRVLEFLRSMFGWYESNLADDDFVSPIRRGMARTKPSERRRKRVLSDQEIRLLWTILGEMGTYGGLVQILLLSGQRLEKVQQMGWDDIGADGLWAIPEKDPREKANAQVLPLPKMAIDIIEAMPRIVGNPFVFASARSGGYFNGLSKAKKALDKKLLAALKAEAEEGGGNPKKVVLKPWVLHTLRHQAKTLMSRCKVPDFDSERVLGHAIPGIGGTYNHDNFKESNKAALKKLAKEVRHIIDLPPTNEQDADSYKAAAE